MGVPKSDCHPRLVIAGTSSSVGKTSITMGLLAALKQRGLTVQSFKVGPDFIDPGFHTCVTGRPCRNLDTWLLSHRTVRHIFTRHAHDADISIIEGVMGLFDSFSPTTDTGSTAEVAKLLKSPVVLVIDAQAMARSAAALVKGFATFDRRLHIAGVIVNKVGGASHYRLVQKAIRKYLKLPVLGYLSFDAQITIPERHLGLEPIMNGRGFQHTIDHLAKQIAQTVDLNAVLHLARRAPSLALGKCHSAVRQSPPSLSSPSALIGDLTLDSRLRRANRTDGLRRYQLTKRPTAARPTGTVPGDQAASGGSTNRRGNDSSHEDDRWLGKRSKPLRIAVAYDEAFNFYYQDNLDLLEELGAELVFFSSLNDRALPADIAGLYIGGGFPEVYAQQLSANQRMRQAVKAAVSRGVPTYAECGGLMYLNREIQDFDGKRYPMVGVLPGRVRMTKRLQSFGYVEVRALRDTILAKKGSHMKGHEFHYSTCEELRGETPAHRLIQRRDGKERLEGCIRPNLVASYVHLHFLTNPSWPRRFLRSAQNFSKR